MPFSKLLAFSNLIEFMLMLLLARPWVTFVNPQNNNVRNGVFCFIVLYILNSVFAFWSMDTYYYWEEFLKAKSYIFFDMQAYEQIYNWFALKLDYNYFLWRIVVWLPACLLFFTAARRLNLLHKNFLLAVIFFSSLVAYTRGILGHVVLLYSVVILFDERNSSKCRLGGLILFVLSYFLHKSMFVNMIFALLAVFRMNKFTTVGLIVAFPFLIPVASMLVGAISSGVISVELGEGVGGAGDRTALYASGESTVSNTFGIISNVIRLFPLYLTFFYMVDRVIFKRYFDRLNDCGIFVYLYNLTFISIYIGSLFMFVEASSFISSRFMYMGYFPLPFVLGKIFSLEASNKILRLIIVLQVFAIFVYWLILFYSN